MALNSDAFLDATETLLLKLGVFDSVNMHEPKSAPGSGITASVWIDSIRPIPRMSGLAATSAHVLLNVRCQTTLNQEPQNGIDRDLARAVDAVMNATTGDFDLGDTVALVDLLGAYGPPLEARAGYLKQDETTFRVMGISLPLVINNVWVQVK